MIINSSQHFVSMKNIWTFFLLSLGYPVSDAAPRVLKLISEWKSIDFNFPTQQLRHEAIASKAFVPGQSVLIDVDVHYKVPGSESRVFVTFPRFRDGIPVTLGTRSAQIDSHGANLIDPFPNYSWHQNPTQDCANKMVSVFRVAIDDCQRLWVVDTGKIGLASSPQVCPPKILVFNLLTDALIHRYIIPENQYNMNPNTFFINPIIDVSDPTPGNCALSKAYIADVAGFSMLVYDSATDSSWRTTNRLFFPCPQFGKHTISGETFELMDGIFGVAVERSHRPNRSLFFHSLASEQENSVPLNALHNRTAWDADEESYSDDFKILGPRGTQSAASAIDSNGNLFFGLNSANAIACWDTKNRPYNKAAVKTLVKDDQKLQFASGMKIIRNTDGEEELWIVTNRFQKVALGTMNINEVNFRIQAQRVSELLIGFKCT